WWMVPYCCSFLFFFFQAEDGIRDPLVTGVQTCALPISIPMKLPEWITGLSLVALAMPKGSVSSAWACTTAFTSGRSWKIAAWIKIGRASCRERVEMAVGGGRVRKEEKRE